MQQTETYKFNLIESTDTFSPVPLNENMQSIEGVLAKQAVSLSEQTEALNTLAAADLKIDMGTYEGTGECGSEAPNSLTFGFQPKLILIMSKNQFCLFMYGFEFGLGRSCRASDCDRFIQAATWRGNTLSWYISEANGSTGPYEKWDIHQFNSAGTTYHYLAIG